MVNSDEFASRLQKVMDYYGLSSSSFADAIEFNRSSISHLISGRNKPSLEFVMKVLDKFPEVKLYWLLNGKGVFPDLSSETETTTAASSPSKEELKHVNDLFHQPDEKLVRDVKIQKENNIIERIVIFYKNGSYKVYEN